MADTTVSQTGVKGNIPQAYDELYVARSLVELIKVLAIGMSSEEGYFCLDSRFWFGLEKVCDQINKNLNFALKED
ncbi:MAG: hypothetical protein LBU06_06770 [Desulfovibrio sp.]|jgi:hypothetical protein|nr:hypothetical protein [Desulfovibrio sp.]